MPKLLTAEELVSEVKRMPPGERAKFFSLLEENAFREDNWTHEQVFGHLNNELFTAQEAADYIEVSLPTLRRYVQSGRLLPVSVVGRSQFFDAVALRAFKHTRNYA
jgi:excisionase family DNA binding protein